PPPGRGMDFPENVEKQEGADVTVPHRAWRDARDDVLIVDVSERARFEIDVEASCEVPVADPRRTEGVEPMDRFVELEGESSRRKRRQRGIETLAREP